jgi:hypothetical protein
MSSLRPAVAPLEVPALVERSVLPELCPPHAPATAIAALSAATPVNLFFMTQ